MFCHKNNRFHNKPCNKVVTISTIVEASQFFDVVEEEAADGGADADVVRERPDDGQDRRLHFWICRWELTIQFSREI